MSKMRILLLLSIIIYPLLLKAEKQKDNFLTRSVVVQEENYLINCRVMVEDVELKIDLKGVYFWFKNSRIWKNEGGYSGSLLHGIYRKYDTEERPIEVGIFHYGRKTGTWKYWNEQGELIRSTVFEKGMKHGLDCIYHSTNQWEKSAYKNNLLHGKKLIQTSDSLFTESYRYGELKSKKSKPLVKTVRKEKVKKSKPKKERKPKKDKKKVKSDKKKKADSKEENKEF
jgi:hypothetical protein